MTNIEKSPMAFENGIPKVGGRWRVWGGSLHAIVGMRDAERVNIDDLGGSSWNYLWRYTGDENQDGAATFLGFADSVNQGAAAPQKPASERITQPCRCGKLCQNATTADLWPAPVPYAGSLHHPSGCIPESAPIAAPPPSLKAAVQQEGLSIPPQVGTRHEYWEASARGAEGRAEAKTYAAKARAALAADLAYDAEADAIRESRIVRKDALKEMGAGDLACFKLRNLREFEAIKSAEHALYFWWKP